MRLAHPFCTLVLLAIPVSFAVAQQSTSYTLAQWTREWTLRLDGLNYHLLVKAADQSAKTDVDLVLEGGTGERLEGNGRFAENGKRLDAVLNAPSGSLKNVEMVLILHYFDRHLLTGYVKPNPSYPRNITWSPISGTSVIAPAKSPLAHPK